MDYHKNVFKKKARRDTRSQSSFTNYIRIITVQTHLCLYKIIWFPPALKGLLLPTNTTIITALEWEGKPSKLIQLSDFISSCQRGPSERPCRKQPMAGGELKPSIMLISLGEPKWSLTEGRKIKEIRSPLCGRRAIWRRQREPCISIPSPLHPSGGERGALSGKQQASEAGRQEWVACNRSACLITTCGLHNSEAVVASLKQGSCHADVLARCTLERAKCHAKERSACAFACNKAERGEGWRYQQNTLLAMAGLTN